MAVVLGGGSSLKSQWNGLRIMAKLDRTRRFVSRRNETMLSILKKNRVFFSQKTTEKRVKDGWGSEIRILLPPMASPIFLFRTVWSCGYICRGMACPAVRFLLWYSVERGLSFHRGRNCFNHAPKLGDGLFQNGH